MKGIKSKFFADKKILEERVVIDSERGVLIKDLKGVELTTLESSLRSVISSKRGIDIKIDSNEPEEILKGTYVAETLSREGYSCHANIPKGRDLINWKCDPPS